MNLLDLALAVVLGLAAYYGLRAGAILLVFSFGGFVGGLFLGARLASITERWVHTTSSRSAVATATLLGMAALCGVLGRLLGEVVARRLHRGLLGSFDAGLGLVVALATTLLSIWLLANTLGTGPYLQVNAAISGSGIVRALDATLPSPPSVFLSVQNFLSAQGFPDVFAGLAPATSAPVALPGTAVTNQALAAAGPSTVKIVGVGCGQIQEGSGFVVAPGMVVTNAHVVAGIPHPQVEEGGGFLNTTVVLFDPSYDLAVLRVPGLGERPLALDPQVVGRGAQGAVLGYPGGGPLTVGPAGVMAVFDAQGRDIYGQGLTVRQVYEIQAVVRPGNSGGPLVEPDGEVVGVVFSRSTTNGDVGYALTSPGVLSRVHEAERTTAAVSTEGCTAG